MYLQCTGIAHVLRFQVTKRKKEKKVVQMLCSTSSLKVSYSKSNRLEKVKIPYEGRSVFDLRCARESLCLRLPT